MLHSYLSLGAASLFFLICLGFARGGGVGAAPAERAAAPAPAAKRAAKKRGGGASASSPAASRGPVAKLRAGGFATQLAVAAAHAGAHLSLAVALLLLVEVAVEMCIRHERLGADGPHSLYRWFEAFERERFPDPAGLRAAVERWTLGLYPGLIKAAMAAFDIPEAVAVARRAYCAAAASAAAAAAAASAGGAVAGGGACAAAAGAAAAGLGRLQVVGYYGGMAAYYW